MRKKFSARAAALGMSGVLLTSALTGCTFGFASDPDDPNAVKEEVPIDMTTDTFQYDTSLSGTSIVIMNTKAEIQTALEKIAKVFEEKAGVHIEIMPVTDGDSPYTKVVSLYNSGNPPTLSILDTTDVIALAEEKAADLSNEAWTGEAEEYLTKINGKVYSFPFLLASVVSFAFRGNGGIFLGAAGLFSFLLSGYGFYVGMKSFKEEQVSHRMSVLGSITSGGMLVAWLALFLIGVR